MTRSPFDIPTTEADIVNIEGPTEHARMCCRQDPPTGVDRHHESREARSLYPLALQLTRDLMLRFIGCAT
jgi:hypothetical protein